MAFKMDTNPDGGEALPAIPPSIFNDVIGPVMRGPSSSHCAAALRIGRLARDLMGGSLEQVLVEFDAHGSLATTHTSQGSDMGLCGGLLGWEASDARLVDSPRALWEAGIEVEMQISDLGAAHPNTYRLTLRGPSGAHTLTALSVGGGMIAVVEIDGFKVSMSGDGYETLFFLGSGGGELRQALSGSVEAEEVRLLAGPGGTLVEVKSPAPLPEETVTELCARFGLQPPRILAPVLPVLTYKGTQVPFLTCQEMLDYNRGQHLELWELAVRYESARSRLAPEEVLRRMQEVVRILQASVQEGLKGTVYADRILGAQSGLFQAGMAEGRLLDGGMLNRMILYVSAMMEAKSAMGVIVAAPTAGSCGGLPGACLGVADALGLSVDEMAKAVLAAGMIGVFIAAHATFAAEVGGCQAECGAGSGMAAAALVTLAKGSAEQATDAASMALQNILGMICDPVAGRVEVPCLGKNVLAASNALACANMALAGYDPVIPLDEVIETMDRVGKALPPELRCTALGGLSVTRASRQIEEKLRRAES